jgi:hypothetical protein
MLSQLTMRVVVHQVPVTIPIMQMMAQGIAALNLRQYVSLRYSHLRATVLVTERPRYRYGIFTISPSRIIMSGKIRMMCFDKTVRATRRLHMNSTVPARP